jgi:hypothetical protein
VVIGVFLTPKVLPLPFNLPRERWLSVVSGEAFLFGQFLISNFSIFRFDLPQISRNSSRLVMTTQRDSLHVTRPYPLPAYSFVDDRYCPNPMCSTCKYSKTARPVCYSLPQ